ncbi:MAG: hypothetical protein VKQ33_02915 [Candidatus Sericytochromatia bacterium]|nr:hypothetical protein [Candidatus Sericytochromatia bacterium]
MGDEAVRFARAFFAFHGATWVPRGPGRVEVGLPESLVEAFGAATLNLGLDPGGSQDASSPAPGGRVFDAMAAHLGARGRCAVLTRRPRACEPVGLRVVGAVAQALPPERADRVARVYDFQLSFLSDERHDVLWSVALDEAGGCWAEATGWLEDATSLEDLAPAAAEGPAGALVEGIPVAEALARAHAEREAAGQEAEAAARLARVRQRLEAYYAELQAELSGRRRPGQTSEDAQVSLEAAQRALAADLARRLAREAQRHRLRVLVRALGHAAIVAPGVRWRWRLATPGRAREVAAWQDLATGHVAWPACERCGHGEGEVGMCGEGHVVCPRCLEACHACGQPSCGPELVSCVCCAAALCRACAARCGRGHACCALHLAACGCCGRVVCERCATPCSACGRPLATGHRCGCERPGPSPGALSPG